MRPIPFIPGSIVLGTAMQTYSSVFIPKNTVSNLKLIRIGFNVLITSVNPNQVGGPFYSEQWNVPGMGFTPRLAPFNVPVVPQATAWYIERTILFDGTTLVELNASGPSPLNSVSHIDGTQHNLPFNALIAPFDRTIDNTLELQAATSFAGSADSILVTSGQAFIQAPLDLGRMPR